MKITLNDMPGGLPAGFTVPPVFEVIADGETIGVHDYAFHKDGTFDYADDVYANQTLVARAKDSAWIFVRPIMSPLEILDMLQSKKCVCGSGKKPMRSSCPPCYHALTPELQKGLYKRFRDGCEQAFLSSLIHLIDEGRTDVARIRTAVPKPKGEK